MKRSLLLGILVAVAASGCAPHPVREPRRPYVDTRTEYEDDERDRESDREERDDSNTEEKPEPFIIRSPFGSHRRMDLTGIKPGSKVEDPTTGGVFIVPNSPDEDPVIVSEPPEDWKPEEKDEEN